MSDTEDEYPNVGVAISTTGDPHRLPFLESNTLRWVAAMPPSAPVFVTVDGDEEAAAYVQGITEAPAASGTDDDVWEEYSPKERYGVGLIAHVRQYELVLSREVCEAIWLKVGTPVCVAYDRTTGRIRVRITDRNDRDAMHASNPESRGKAKLSLKVSAAGFIKKFGASLGRYSVEVPQKGVAILSLVKAKTSKAKEPRAKAA